MNTILEFGRIEDYSSQGGSPMRPCLAMRLQNGQAFFDTLGLVDSGADRSLFHIEHALALGLVLNPAMAQQVESVGGTSQAWYFDIQLSVGSELFSARVGFSAGCPREFGLLGREDFFRAFDVAFQQTQLRFLLQPTS